MASTSDSTNYWAAVTPSDTANIRGGDICNFLYVGVTGDVTCQVISPVTGATIALLFKALPVGYHPIRTSRVNATGTTATSINAAY